jgi:recombination protein RecA
MERTKKAEPLSVQMKKKVEDTKKEEYVEFEGTFLGNNISTGSTLLDLAISGGRVRGGGLPAGVLVEIFGPSGSGKTVLLSEIAGNIQSKGGEVIFHDPEARLNKQFAEMFGLTLKEEDYSRPDTIPEVFETVRDWEPKNSGKIIHGIMADSLAALSTDMEMDKSKGDKMGMRRAKEFSEELRKTCRILAQNNYLMVCSNQVRVNVDAGPYGQKYSTPGGEAVAFYASCRLRTNVIKKHKKEKTYKGKSITRIVGIDVEVEVAKNSIWKPYRSAPVTIIFDYGIDDIRQNLQFIKNFSKSNVYTIGSDSLDKSMDESIKMIEDQGYEERLRQEVILLWNKIELQFDSHRKPKR